MLFEGSVDSRPKYRFDQDGIFELLRALDLPEQLTMQNRVCWQLEEALLLLLRRLAYPCRLGELESMWGRDKTQLSRCFNSMMCLMYSRFQHHITNKLAYWSEHFTEFCDSIKRKLHTDDAAMTVVAFIDGKVQPICRPSSVTVHGVTLDVQREMYNGHKRTHGVKIQAVHAPNGMTIDYYGVGSGRRHDAHLLRISELNDRMAIVQAGWPRQHVIYGDAAYGGTNSHIRRGHVGANLDNEQRRQNEQLSKVRVSVEWGFAKIYSLWAFLDYKKTQKLLLQPLGQYIAVAVFLTNCHSCLYGNQTASYFGVAPPTLDAYLNG